MGFETNERIRDLDPFVKLVQNWGRKTTVTSLALTAPVATEQETLKNKIAAKSPPLAVSVDICGLFPERQTSIWKHLDQRRWMQWTRPLLDNQILGVMSNEGRGLYRGCYWGTETRHGVVDIDQGSKYREPEELALITSRFAAVGLNLVPFQSSGSGGWHLYYFLDDWAPSKEIELTLRKLSEQGWQSDTRAVNMMVLSESYRRHGPARIKAKARNKGLGELVEQALEQSQIDWEQQAKEAVERKFGPGPFERALQVKVAQFLLRKGYPIDVAWKMARLEPDDGHIPDGCD